MTGAMQTSLNSADSHAQAFGQLAGRVALGIFENQELGVARGQEAERS